MIPKTVVHSVIVSTLIGTSLYVVPTVASAQTACYEDEDGRIVTRRRPGFKQVECPSTDRTGDRTATEEPGQVQDAAERADIAAESRDSRRRPERSRNPISPIPRPGLDDYVGSVPLPDRWRVVESLGYKENIFDPYNRNVLKADRPVDGEWFFNLSLISDTVYEVRDVATPVGSSSTNATGGNDVFGSADQYAIVQNLATEFVYYKGDTVFKPPDWEFRFTPVLNYNYTSLDEILGVKANPENGRTRTDYHLGIQAAFVDKHLRNVSERYDFDSIRIGIQPFSSDFRGFLFQDNQLGVRLFGTRHNNIFQYNLAWFRRIEKDTNSGLNDIGKALRDDDVFIANVYWQDMPTLGFTSQVTIAYNRNRDDSEFHFDKNNFIQRPASFGREVPREYDIHYLGYTGDGHFGRLNLSTSVYYAFGKEKPGVFVDSEVDVEALFAAVELSMDFDWFRPRFSALFGSGDDDPYDDKATGFDAIFENPQFAGADTSYWIRQAVPLIGGGRVALSSRNGILNNLRSSKEEGQSNFTNPGIILFGLGADMDLLPQLRLSLNLNSLYFVHDEVLEAARNQANIGHHIGEDLSVSLIYRPLMSQNIVVRASYAELIAGDAFDALFPDEDSGYFLLNVVLAY